MWSAVAPVWVVAGAPGAGKTTVAKTMAAAMRPRAALLDKDTLYGSFVAAWLAEAGRPAGEREGQWYDVNIKVHEYAGLAATAAEIRSAGCPVVLCAPYSSQIRDQDLWDRLVADLGGVPVHLIWVCCDPHVLRRRLLQRGSARDGQKLDHYERFIAAVRPDDPPTVAHQVIDNTGDGIDRLRERARRATPASKS